MTCQPKSSAFEAVIFDLDGVIVSTDEYHYRSWKKLADEEGIPFDRTFNHNFRGVSRMECINMLVERAGHHYTEEEKKQLHDRKNVYYKKYIQNLKEGDLLPGVRKLLDELKNRKVKIAIASGSKNARYIVKRLNLEDEIMACISGNDIKNSKPNPEVFLTAAEELNVRPEKCVAVEDAQSGIEAAKRAGMTTVAVGEHPLEGADITVKSLEELSADDILNPYHFTNSVGKRS
jgi:beta-phosphoglucomutase